MPDTHTYTVRGHWPFPLEMLTRDQSEGAPPHDQSLISKLTSQHAENDEYFVDVDITLTGPNPPLWQRWASFQWEVIDDPQIDAIRSIEAASTKERHIFASAMAKLTDEEQLVVRKRLSHQPY